MSKSRAPLAIGLAAAGGVGYYLYSAGGSPRAAEKQFESDAHHIASKIKGEAPPTPKTGAEGQARKVTEDVGSRLESAGSKVDSAMANANRDLSKAKSEAESYAKATKAETLKKIDEFDRKVEEGASKSKGWFSSWFGGK
ncbi:hypothetical protein VTK26DRAFT_1409 [Humicola hyalothermophila]